jgi:N-acetyl-anhydromuramyl-L-alanine amidase AmpD
VRPYQQSSVEDIDRWHRARGWKNGCGYHYVIRRDGTIEIGRPLEMIGAHCKNRNRHSIGICYEGGLNVEGRPSDTRTKAQTCALRTLLEQLHTRFPKAMIMGHNVFNPMKACPCFNAAEEYRDLQPK